MMLSIRPNCEHCDKDLPNGASDAMICSYECTFCAACVDTVLLGVCPNCAGGFVPRPVRPVTAWHAGISAQHQLPSVERVNKPVDPDAHAVFAAKIKTLSPAER